MTMDIQKYKKILYRSFVGSDLSNLDSDLNKYDIGTITAFRSEFSYDQNCARSRQLLTYFLDKKYGVALVNGSYIEDLPIAKSAGTLEKSYFISDQFKLGMLLTDLKKLGNYFDQDSILFKPANEIASLYGLSDRATAYPKKGEIVGLSLTGQGKVTAQFFSRVKDRQFAVESVVKMEYPGTINGMYCLNREAKELDI